MTVSIPASEIAVGDYSITHGTITSISETRDKITNELQSLKIKFHNGDELTNVEPTAEFDIIGGGLTDHGPIGGVRSGLAEDRKK
jgi:hypothetical protein